MSSVKVFAEGVTKQITEFLPSDLQDVQCSVVENVKNNSVVMTGITFHMPGKNVAPVIYMEPFFEKIKNGEPVNQVMDNIANCFRDCHDCQDITKGIDMNNYESVKEYIMPMVINTRRNRRMLTALPHERMEDLSVIYKVMFPNDRLDGVSSVKITEEIADRWGVSQSKLHKQAMDNGSQKRPPILQGMEVVARELLFQEKTSENLLEAEGMLAVDEPMYILSNPERMEGASVLAYPDLLKQVDAKFDGGCYILPSSIHECIVVPKRMGMSPKELGDMVREVNAAEVDREEVLSDRVYEYDRDRNCLCQVEASLKQREMER